MKKLLSLVLACAMLLTLAAAASAEDVTLRMAVGYNNANTGLAFSPDIAGEGITLADGNTYHTGDLKPTWVEMEKILSEITGNNVIVDGTHTRATAMPRNLTTGKNSWKTLTWCSARP